MELSLVKHLPRSAQLQVPATNRVKPISGTVHGLIFNQNN